MVSIKKLLSTFHWVCIQWKLDLIKDLNNNELTTFVASLARKMNLEVGAV